MSGLRICCLSICLIVFSQTVWGASRPAFWRVTDEDSSVYLLGSIHFGDKSFYPLPEQIEKAYRNADALAVEVDLNRVSSKAMAASVQRYAVLPGGQSLRDFVGTPLHTSLQTFCREKGLSAAAFQHLQPWFIALQLVQMELADSSWQSAWGVDRHFLNKAQIPVVELESLDFQLSVLAGFSPTEQNLFLQQTLKELSQSVGYLRSMGQAWRGGNIEALESLMLDAFMDDQGPGEAIFQKMFVDRNRGMVGKIKQFLQDDRNVFVVVGAGHMLGEWGIVEQMRNSGYGVERVQYSTPD